MYFSVINTLLCNSFSFGYTDICQVSLSHTADLLHAPPVMAVGGRTADLLHAPPVMAVGGRTADLLHAPPVMVVGRKNYLTITYTSMIQFWSRGLMSTWFIIKFVFRPASSSLCI